MIFVPGSVDSWPGFFAEAAVILVTYLVMQSKFSPWKARSINVADASLNSLLLLGKKARVLEIMKGNLDFGRKLPSILQGHR